MEDFEPKKVEQFCQIDENENSRANNWLISKESYEDCEEQQSCKSNYDVEVELESLVADRRDFSVENVLIAVEEMLNVERFVSSIGVDGDKNWPKYYDGKSNNGHSEEKPFEASTVIKVQELKKSCP